MAPRGWKIAGAVAVAGMSVALAAARQSAAPAPIALPGTPLSLLALDADGDARPDLVVSLDGGPARLVLLRNAGGGAFDPPVPLPDLAAGTLPALRGLVAVDVDRDGRMDVVGTGTPSALWRSTGDGTFTVEALPPGADGAHPATGDLDSDGATDLLVLREGPAPAVVVLLNDGAGRFTPLPPVPAPEAWPVRQVVVADVDHDGLPDVALLRRPAGRVLLLRNTGGGALAAPAPLDVPEGCFALGVRTLDGALVAFGAHVARTFAAGGTTDAAMEGGDLADGAVPGDADGDHADELVTTTDDGRLVALVPGEGPAERLMPWGEARRLDAAPAAASPRLAVADLDGDGRPDAAALAWRPRPGIALLLARDAVAAPGEDPALDLVRGRIRDLPRRRGDRLWIEGSIPPAAIEGGDPLRLIVAAGDVSVETFLEPSTGLTYRSTPDSGQRAKATFDAATGRFVFLARSFDLPGPPANPVVVTLEAGGRRWSRTANWQAPRPGELVFALEPRRSLSPAPGAAGPGAPIVVQAPAAPAPFEVLVTTSGGREVRTLRERATGREWTLDGATGRWLPRSKDLARPAPSLDAGLVAFLPLETDMADTLGGAVEVRGGVAVEEGSLRFDGSGWIELPHVALNDRAHAFSMWIRVEGDADVMGLVEQRDADAGGRHYHLMLRGTLQPFLGFYMNDLSAPDSLDRGAWHHLVFQYTGREQEIWIDGVRAARRAASPYRGTSGGTRIGRNPDWNNVGGTHFTGSMRRLRIYDRGLSGEDIASLRRRELPGELAAPARTTLTFEGPIDGSDRIVVTPAGARWENLHWGTVRGVVTLNGVPWEPRIEPVLKNDGATRFLPPGVDFSKARLVSRSGRDFAGMEAGPDGLVLRFVDSPNGPAPYRVVVEFE